MVSYSTYGGWAGIVVIGAGYWYLQNRRTTNRPNRPVSQKQTNKSTEARKDGKSKKQRNEGSHSSGDQGNTSQEKGQKKKKQKVASLTVDDDTRPTTTAFAEDTNDDEVDNQEFARQFQNTKSGTITASRPQMGSRQKSVKQSQAKDIPTTNSLDTSSNAASSTAGADGDDDLSAANSPALGATKLQTLRSGDVSDMLESPSAGPSVLRITEPTTSSQPKKGRKPAQPVEVTETKKQRQNRKKAEAARQAREEEEKERRVRLEKQRRTAREAEGRAAKDGSSFMAAKAPVSSAWAGPLATSSGQNISTPMSVELLDTHEPTANGVSRSSGPQTSTTSGTKTNNDWHKALPSEEEQLRLLEEETAWNTVISKKGKKKGGEAEPAQGQKISDNGKPHAQASETLPGKATSSSTEANTTASMTIVGDPSIDMSNFSYKGGPANAVLENGDGLDYGYKMEDDEWEVA